MGATLAALAEGQTVEGSFLLIQKAVLTTKTGKPYGALKLGDRSGEVDAKLWDRAEEALGPLCAGMVVRICGRAESFQGRSQLVLSALEPDPEARPADFLPSSPVPRAELETELGRLTGVVANKHLRRLLKAVFSDDPAWREAFLAAPAAKGAHHAYVGGLVEHTVSCAGLALKIAEHYGELDRDLLLAGALIHDVGKVEELTLGPPIDYTDAGRLEGHVALGARLLERRLAKLKGFPEAAAAQLRHLVLSHHGAYEFGSPRRPKTPEAFVLHMADDLDAKLFMLRAARAAAGEGDRFSAFNRLLERFLWTGPSPWEQEAQASGAPAAACRPAGPSLFDLPPNGEEP